MSSTPRPRVAAGLLVLSVLLAAPLAARAQSACDPAVDGPIVCENRRPGAPPTEWDIEGAGDPSIQGFSTVISAQSGETVGFKVDTDAAAYRLDIYRLGYYGGSGARKIATVMPSVALPLAQPACLSEPATGLIDCGNWTTTASWVVPADAVSGLYVARLVRSDTGGASHILFIVRDDDRASEMLVKVADTTWQAYNDYGGNSLYVGSPANRAFKVSYNRPLVLRGNDYRRASFWATAWPTVRWLEANGYDVTYTTALDVDRDGAPLLRHRTVMALGHDEYWSADERAHVQAARDAGVNLAFISGNTMFWKTRWEPSIDGSGTPYRTLVTYKESHPGEKIDPLPTSTGTWRDPRFGTADMSGVPENELVGTLFIVNCCRFDSIVVSAEQGRRRFWRNTEVARQPDGGSMTIGRGIVGYEWDSDVDNGRRPPGLFRLSAANVDGAKVLADYGNTYRFSIDPAQSHLHLLPAVHNITMYRAASGALVFSTATVDWGWALDATHDDPDQAAAPVDMRIQQATVNVLADMGVQPRSLQPELIRAEMSTDHVAPRATMAAPTTGSMVRTYLTLDVHGEASDEGGVVAGVEVSTDGGLSWHPATGTTRWHYEMTPLALGPMTVLARAVDDSGNLQPYPAWAIVEVEGLGLRRLAMIVGAAGLGFVVVLGAGIWLVRRRRRRA